MGSSKHHIAANSGYRHEFATAYPLSYRYLGTTYETGGLCGGECLNGFGFLRFFQSALLRCELQKCNAEKANNQEATQIRVSGITRKEGRQ